MPTRIILASGSPRRRELLALTGLDFECRASDYEEDMGVSLPPAELAMRLSEGKAADVAGRTASGLVIGADTFIAFRGAVLGKPHTAERARQMLAELSGQPHSVITGFTVIDTASGRRASEAVESRVFFRPLSAAEIEAYVSSGEPLDKAGAYAIQGQGRTLIERIDGDYFNIVGLPLGALCRYMAAFGLAVPRVPEAPPFP